MKCKKNIFSGRYSSAMWKDINNAKTVEDLQEALYFVCCRIQELEALVQQHQTYQTKQGVKEVPRE